MEIVSEPAMHSAEEAFAFLTSLRMTMVQGAISDCDMEKGQLRCDANISIRPIGQTKLGVKVELKNLNSISYVRDGIALEIRRQTAVLTGGGSIVQETRQYDGEAGTSVAMRSKEMAHDYRYFPDPDLLPVQVDAAWRATIQATIPELPYARQRRFITQYQLPYTITAVLVPERALADFFEEVAQLCGHPQAVANWLVNDLRRELAAGGIALAVSKLRPAHLAALVNLVEQGESSITAAKEGFNDMFQTGEAPAVIVMRKNLKQSTDSGALEQWVQAAIVANPKAVAEFLAGKEQAINAVKGAVMKASQGKANPRLVDELVRRQLLAGKS